MHILFGVVFFMFLGAIFGNRVLDAIMYGIIIMIVFLLGAFFYFFVLPSQTWQGL